MNRIFLLALFLSACTTLPVAPTTETPDVPAIGKPVDSAAPALSADIAGCPTFSFNAVDVAQPVTQKFLDAMKAKGVKLIIRYGDHPNETIRGKTPTKAELELIKKNGFYFLAVFQHNNRWEHYTTKAPYDTFRSAAAARGKKDAERMQELYPDARSWYYGVDFDAHTEIQLKGVTTYATEFKKVADKYGKPVGAYGGGKALKMLESKGLIHYLWVSMSTGFTETGTLTKSGKYHLLQKLWKPKCAGFSLDADVTNQADVGQWVLQ